MSSYMDINLGVVYKTDIKQAQKENERHREARIRRRMVLLEVDQERSYQNMLWGGPTHDDQHTSHDWIAYIVHQLGKAQMEPFNLPEFRKRMVKVAALAVAAVEWSDRLAEVEGKEGKG